MIEQQKNFLGIHEKLAELDNKVNMLQDLMLKMRNDFKIFYETNLRFKSMARVHERVNSSYNTFYTEIPSSCRAKEQCSLIVENKVLKALRIYQMEGSREALKYMQESKEKLKRLAIRAKCENDACMTNVYNIFTALDELINKSQEKKEITELDGELLDIDVPILEEEIDEDISDFLIPLSNKVRLRILKILTRGMKLFTELEQESGIKGGHLQYHLKYLLKASFIEKQGTYYQITAHGLIILKNLNQLKKKLHL
ncbi:MAG: DUF7347 domain-containing protein [Promethearchaeota archaeon]